MTRFQRGCLVAVGLGLFWGLGLEDPRGVGAPESKPASTRSVALPRAPFVMRVYYETIADIERLAGYDVWETNNLEERYVLVSGDETVYRRLDGQGWRLAIDRDATASLRQPAIRAANDPYRSVEQLYLELAATNAAYPEITELVDYGDSYCKMKGGCVTPGGDPLAGHDLLALRVTNRNIPGPKPVFFLIANIHAREITTPELAMRWIDWLTQGYGVEADITWLVDHHELWVVPTANPDGRWLVDLGTEPRYNDGRWFQRKNANRDNGCNAWPPTPYRQYGVDLNRNHTFQWNTGGSSPDPCEQTYRGPRAGSEPEVDQLQALIATVIPDQRGNGPSDPAPLGTTGIFISLHSYGESVLRPWGNRLTPTPNEAGLKAIGDKFATYNGYMSCQASVCLYVASGTSDDWTYGELGIPSYTFEVGTQFMPPYGEIDASQWPDNAPALLYAAKIARTPYYLAQGPDAQPVGTVPLGNGWVLLWSVINDWDNGGDAVYVAFSSIDKPYWEPGFSPRVMFPLDGANDSPVEVSVDFIDTNTLAPGRHIVYVHGLDVQGYLGPASATFIDVP